MHPHRQKFFELKQDSTDTSQCVACAVNQITDATSGCVDCADLEVVKDNACTACSLDQYVKTGTDGVRECTDCNVNQIVQNNVCNDCPDGQIRDEDSGLDRKMNTSESDVLMGRETSH